MAQQRLYTEEHVIKAIELAQECDSDCGGVYFHYGNSDIINVLTPIELPSDEEIDLQIEKTIEGEFMGYPSAFRKGAKWMRDQILNK